jgi:hypothetical protein
LDEGEPVSIWPYTTRRWERVRQQKMMRDPLCEACLTVGEIVPAEVVDHRRPISKEGRAKRSAAEAFPPLDQLASLCASTTTKKPAPNNAVRTTCAKGVMFLVVQMTRIIRGTKGRRYLVMRRHRRLSYTDVCFWPKADIGFCAAHRDEMYPQRYDSE